MAERPPDYPEHRVVDVALRDGSTVRIRPVLPEDSYDIVDFFERLDPDSVSLRFHGLRKIGKRDAETMARVDYNRTFALIAETSRGDTPRAIGLASYAMTGESNAEIGLAVDDPFQGRGIGSILMEHLAEAASENGISTFEAEVLARNANMLEVIRATELPADYKVDMGVIHVEFPTSPSDDAIEAFELREATAAAAGVRAFLEPRSVAVIGASRTRGTIGAELFRNLLDLSFEGPVYPVNPKAEVVQSISSFPTVTAIPGPVDLAVIVVPATVVLEVAQECGTKGVKALLIISSGFSEVGDAGRERQKELVEIARRYGMRIIGPNCMGIMNLDPDVRLNASFAPITPSHGTIAFSSQSGALGIAIMDRARQLGLGLSSFVSVGNKADISGNDLLQYWEQDPATEVVLLYLESFGNPRKFARIARRVSRKKPIVAVKSGRSDAGARAAASHTGSLAAGDVAVDALFRQAGVIRTDTLDDMFDVASLVAHQPLPSGKRVAILTNAGGLGILCADACEASGLTIPSLAEATVSALEAMLPAEASVANPVDMIASATAEQYAQALKLIVADPMIDSVIVIFIPPLVTRAEDVARAVVEAAAEIEDKTVLTCWLGVRGIHEQLRTKDLILPSYMLPESAAHALARVSHYAEWRERPEGSTPRFEGVEREKALSLAARSCDGNEAWLPPETVETLLSCYDIRTARSGVAHTPEEVGDLAGEFGGKVVVKIRSEQIVHKTDVGGVRLNLEGREEARAAAAEILDGLARRDLVDQIEGFLVQEMITGEGAEMFVGMTHDPSFGPLLACGAGGTLVELIRDVSIRITPLTDVDVDEMLHSLKTYPLLEGYRGSPKLDIDALKELLLRISVLVEDIGQLAELDLNPVRVLPDGEGCIVLDARMRMMKPEPPTPRGARLRPR
jgi:acetyl coenzyme A synthetase (ADP forming)-like protein